MKRRVTCIHIDEELIRLVDDLVASIEDAGWGYNLHHPTPHMARAVEAYRAYKRANNV